MKAIPGEDAGTEPGKKRNGHGPAFGADVASSQGLTDGVISFKADGQYGQYGGVRGNQLDKSHDQTCPSKRMILLHAYHTWSQL